MYCPGLVFGRTVNEREQRLARETTDLGPLLLDLNLHHFARVLDDFGDVGTVTSSDLPQDPLVEVDGSSDQPIFPENAKLHETAVRWSVGLLKTRHVLLSVERHCMYLDHAEHLAEQTSEGSRIGRQSEETTHSV